MKDEIIRMAREANLVDWGFDSLEWEPVASREAIERFYNLIVQHEREECAKACEELLIWNEDDPGDSAAKAIRARGEKQ